MTKDIRENTSQRLGISDTTASPTSWTSAMWLRPQRGCRMKSGITTETKIAQVLHAKATHIRDWLLMISYPWHSKTKRRSTKNQDEKPPISKVPIHARNCRPTLPVLDSRRLSTCD